MASVVEVKDELYSSEDDDTTSENVQHNGHRERDENVIIHSRYCVTWKVTRVYIDMKV